MATSAVPLLLQQCRAVGLPEPETEVRFHPVRKWRADLLWRHPRKLIVEVNGGGWVGGRHNTGAGAEKDYEKLAEALVLGYPSMQVTPRQVKTGQAVAWIAQYLQEPQ